MEETKPLFSCKTKSNKFLELHKQDNTITYKFGKINSQPELELKKSLDEVEILIGNASGSELTNSISFANGEYTYTVISSVNKVADVQEPKHGILVKKNSNYLTYISCISASVEGSLLDFE
ncbi:hypothetical protein C1896_01495 [Pseudomonadaceae bacterium SI-3]|nr:hypothetical protein C1896_01495 [Pseudomonadaceae bacterium SI-3]